MDNNGLVEGPIDPSLIQSIVFDCFGPAEGSKERHKNLKWLVYVPKHCWNKFWRIFSFYLLARIKIHRIYLQICSMSVHMTFDIGVLDYAVCLRKNSCHVCSPRSYFARSWSMPSDSIRQRQKEKKNQRQKTTYCSAFLHGWDQEWTGQVFTSLLEIPFHLKLRLDCSRFLILGQCSPNISDRVVRRRKAGPGFVNLLSWFWLEKKFPEM